jgi:hypothetical protein
MDNNTRKKYIEFMLDNIIDSNIEIQLPSPQDNGKLHYVELGPIVFINVNLEVVEIYTRSVKFKFKFDKYEVEKIIYIPINSSPTVIKVILDNTLTRLVYDTFINDGRRDDIKQMYIDRTNEINTQLIKLINTAIGIAKEQITNITYKHSD